MFVTAKDFDLIPYSIPNLQQQEETFPLFVDEIEEQELRKLFGSYFYDAFIAALQALPAEFMIETAYAVDNQVSYGNSIYKALEIIPNTNTVPPVAGPSWEVLEADNRWLMLKNGSKYSYYNRPFLWKGMKELCKGFVYAYWLREYQITTGLGTVQPKAENSDLISPALKQVRGYNRFVDLAIGRNQGYTMWGYWEMENSLYGFTWNKSDLYDDLFGVGTDGLGWTNFRSYLSQMFCPPERWNVFNL